MDPWLESNWQDVRHAIVQYGCDQLADNLPEGLYAMRIDYSRLPEPPLSDDDAAWAAERVQRRE